MKPLLRILIVEDSEDDTLLVLRQIKKGGYNVEHERVETAETMKVALREKTWDIVLSDYHLPYFNGLEALEVLKESGIDIPFIVISGTIGEDIAVEAMKAGVHDYFMKNNMHRLVLAIERELREAKNRVERKLLEWKQIQAEALRVSEEKYRYIFDNISDGIFLLEVTEDCRFRNLEMNSSLANLTGIDRNYMIGKFQEEVVPEKTANIVNTKYRHCVERGHPIEEESELELPVGKRFFLSTLIPVRNEVGRIHRIVGITRDITKRKQMEAALRESEEKHRILFMDSPDAYLILIDDVFVDCNHATEMMMRGNRTQIIGLPLEKLSPEFQPDGRKSSEAAREKIKKALQTGTNTFEWMHRRLDGSIFFVEVSIASLMLEGKPALFTTWRDITGRKHVEEALLESEERYRQLVEMSPDAIAIHQQGKIVYINAAGAKQFGAQKPQEMIGKSILDLVHPDYRVAVIQRVEKTLRGDNAPYTVEKFIKLDGTIFDVEVSVIPSVYQGKPATQVIVRDITKRKQAEEALSESQQFLSEVIENSGALIYVKDCDGYYELVNRKWEEVTGIKRELTVGKTDEGLFPGTVGKEFRKMDIRVMESGKIIESEEILEDATGKRFFLTIKIPLWNKYNEIKGTIGISTEITERKRTEDEIKLKNEELLKLNSEKDKFFSIIAHDLRSPFSAFLGLTEIMAEKSSGLSMDEMQWYAINMRDSATKLFRLLENLLQWASVQQGLIPINPKLIQLHPIVDESISIVLESAKNKGIEIVYNIQDDLEVFADSNMLQTVIRNLVSNAVKFTPKGGKISLSAKVTGDKSVEISIKDTGIGMNSAMVDNLFRLDVRTNRLGTDGEPSTGLGLLLCKEFVEKHGGKIWVKSKERNLSAGKAGGTTFYFTIP